MCIGQVYDLPLARGRRALPCSARANLTQLESTLRSERPGQGTSTRHIQRREVQAEERHSHGVLASSSHNSAPGAIGQ